jgi:hypothetical protein
MPRLFHVSSTLNRESIQAHGLDWTRMGAAPGIAGSPTPEVAGIFLARDEFEVSFFLQMAESHGSLDVWAVEGIDAEQLVDNGSGFGYYPSNIPRSQLSLLDASGIMRLA